MNNKRDHTRYIYWFLKLNSPNAGNEALDESLLAKFSEHGWPI